MEYRNKGLRARRILKMVDELESGIENNDFKQTEIHKIADNYSTCNTQINDLNNAPTASYAQQENNHRELGLDIREVQNENVSCENFIENDLASCYLDIVHERVIRTPSSVSNLSYIFDNVDFIASPEGIIRAVKSKSETPTQFDCPLYDTAFNSIDRNIDETLKANENNNTVNPR